MSYNNQNQYILSVGSAEYKWMASINNNNIIIIIITATAIIIIIIIIIIPSKLNN